MGMQKIYKLHYSFWSGGPTTYRRVEKSSTWFLSKTQMLKKHSRWLSLQENPKREFQYTIEESCINTDCE